MGWDGWRIGLWCSDVGLEMFGQLRDAFVRLIRMLRRRSAM